MPASPSPRGRCLVTREPRGNLVYFKPVTPLAENICTMVCGHVTARIQSAYQSLA